MSPRPLAECPHLKGEFGHFRCPDGSIGLPKKIAARLGEPGFRLGLIPGLLEGECRAVRRLSCVRSLEGEGGILEQVRGIKRPLLVESNRAEHGLGSGLGLAIGGLEGEEEVLVGLIEIAKLIGT